jgi:hypothetical protein
MENILSHIRTNFIQELTGEERPGEEIGDDYIISCPGREYSRKINPKYYNYDYDKIKQNNKIVYDIVKTSIDQWKPESFSPPTVERALWESYNIKKYLENMDKNEYIIYITATNYGYTLCNSTIITNFGSLLYVERGGLNQCILVSHPNKIEIPKMVMDMFIYIFDTVLPKLHYVEMPGKIEYLKEMIAIFQRYWILKPMTEHSVKYLLRENKELKDKIEELQQEQGKIKHMYEALELKDQYYNVVELLKQNKKEREQLDKDRRLFYYDREAYRLEMEKKMIDSDN